MKLELKDYLKLRYMFLKEQEKSEEHLATRIRISAKIHEIRLFLEFIENGSIENIYKIK